MALSEQARQRLTDKLFARTAPGCYLRGTDQRCLACEEFKQDLRRILDEALDAPEEDTHDRRH